MSSEIFVDCAKRRSKNLAFVFKANFSAHSTILPFVSEKYGPCETTTLESGSGAKFVCLYECHVGDKLVSGFLLEARLPSFVQVSICEIIVM